MSKNGFGTPESIPGRRSSRYNPDLAGTKNASLNHQEKFEKRIGRRPTLSEVAARIEAKIGTIPYLMFMLPYAASMLPDMDSIGAEVGHDVPFHTIVHALHASSSGSGEHAGVGDIQTERTTMGDRIYTDKRVVKEGQNSFFIVDNPPQIDNSTSNNIPEKSFDYDQYSFDDGTQYYHAGDAGFFMVYNPSPEVGSTRLSFGNQIPLEMKEQLNGELALFDLSNSALSASPIQDQSGVSGFEVVRGGVSPEALKLLLANHSPRRGNATERSIDLAASNGGGQINLMIRVEESTDLQGKPEKIVKFYALGSDSRTLLATKEIHPGGISLATESPKNAMLSRITNSGEQVLLVTPSFPESTPSGYVVWVDENGKVFAGEGYGDKKLILEAQSGDGVWVEAVPKAETITIDGVSMTLGEPDANGWSEVTDKSIVEEMSAVDAANKLEIFDPGFVGFAPDEAKLVYNEASQKLQIVNPAGEAIAVWNHGAKEMVWDYDMMFVNGENVLFRIAKTWEMNGINPVDMDAAKADHVSLKAQYDPYLGVQYKGTWLSKGFVFDSSGGRAIGVMWVTKEQLPPMEMDRIDVAGEVFFLDSEGVIVKLKVKNMDGMNRFWN